MGGYTHILGAGSHGDDIAEIAARLDIESRFLDEDPTMGLLPVPPPPGRCYVGINDPQQRRSAVQRLGLEGDEPLVDPAAITGPNCILGAGVVLAPFTLLHYSVQLGDHVHVNYGSMMTRCCIGDYTTIAPSVCICGDVQIGEAVMIGCGAIIKNLITIGDQAIVGAGAVVVEDVPAGATVVGIPARARGLR